MRADAMLESMTMGSRRLKGAEAPRRLREWQPTRS
jgi:hypothetical protein